jgi:chromosome segregation ATPase
MGKKEDLNIETKMALLEQKLDNIHETLVGVISELKAYNKNIIDNNEILTKLEVKEQYRDSEIKNVLDRVKTLDKSVSRLDDDVRRVGWNFRVVYVIISILGAFIGFILREYISKTFF